jgi:glutamyl-tRNA reductase
MNIAVIGLSHKTAPVNIRERLAFDSAQTLKALRELKGKFSEVEFVLLSTCNRVELYVAGRSEDIIGVEKLIEFLAKFHNVRKEEFRDFIYVYKDEDAARHLLTVASSLDSMVVGEGQIINQVKEGYSLACEAGSTGKVLNRLFHRSFSVAKKVYTTTSIANGRVSVAGVAVELAKQLFSDILSAKVLVIGAGEMGELLVQHLLHAGSKQIVVINRTFGRSSNMVERYGIEAKDWQELEDQLIDADIVIACAAVQDYLFEKESFKQIAAHRQKKMMLIIDIAVPRNFEQAVNEIEGVHLYSVDDLSEVARQNRKAREEDIARGMEIIHENADEFMDWLKSHDIGPLIGRMKEKFTQITQEELEQFCAGDRRIAARRVFLAQKVNRIVNRLLHSVIKDVNTVAKEQGPDEAAKLIEQIVQQADESGGTRNKVRG